MPGSIAPAMFWIGNPCWMSTTCVALLAVQRGYYRDETPCIWVRMTLNQNSVMLQFVGGDAKGSKTKLYSISKNQSLTSIRRENMKGCPPYDLAKWLFLSSWNSVCSFNNGPKRAFLGVLTFQPHSTLSQSNMVFCGQFFSFFSVYPRITPL